MLFNLFSRAIEHAIAGFETLDLRGGGRTEAPKSGALPVELSNHESFTWLVTLDHQ